MNIVIFFLVLLGVGIIVLFFAIMVLLLLTLLQDTPFGPLIEAWSGELAEKLKRKGHRENDTTEED